MLEGGPNSPRLQELLLDSGDWELTLDKNVLLDGRKVGHMITTTLGDELLIIYLGNDINPFDFDLNQEKNPLKIAFIKNRTANLNCRIVNGSNSDAYYVEREKTFAEGKNCKTTLPYNSTSFDDISLLPTSSIDIILYKSDGLSSKK